MIFAGAPTWRQWPVQLGLRNLVLKSLEIRERVGACVHASFSSIKESVKSGRVRSMPHNSNPISVTAPSDALVTALAYFASTPRV
jgi:hypothetical protein